MSTRAHLALTSVARLLHVRKFSFPFPSFGAIGTASALTVLLSGCTGDSLMNLSWESAVDLRADSTASEDLPTALPVQDLDVADASESAITVRWTQVPDGTGAPAQYRVRYSLPKIDWTTANDACVQAGDQVGAETQCTIDGLEPGTAYEIQLMSHWSKDSSWTGGANSNVVRGETTSRDAPEVPLEEGAVNDLTIVAATSGTLDVRWTQVDDGTGAPARYRVKYAEPSIDYGVATVGCDRSGTQVGAVMSCTIPNLESEKTYDVQLMSYRTVDGVWQDALYSNVATSSTAPAPVASLSTGIWIDRDQLMRLPTSGAAWDRLRQDAAGSFGSANISDQDSHHDVYTMAAALVCARTGELCSKARKGVLDAMGTERGRWLTVGRNLAAYIIAADLLDLRADGNASSSGTRVETWVRGWLTKRLPDNLTSEPRPFGPFHSSANAAAQEGLAYVAVAAYLDDKGALERGWDAFRTFVCDQSAPDRESINLRPIVRDGWTHDAENPCAVNPMGTKKVVPPGYTGAGALRRIDGALNGDMRRGGAYQWRPGYTQYPWVGLEGLIPAAIILERAGYPAFQVADRAVLRTHEYLWYLRQQTGNESWFDGRRAREIVEVINSVYGTSYPIEGVVGRGRTVGYTSWTHGGS